MKRVSLLTEGMYHEVLSNFNRNILRFSLVSFYMFIFSIYVQAATRTSTATGGTWSAGTTWIGGVAPSTTDIAIIATTGSNTVTLGANTTIASVTVNSGARLNLAARVFTVNGSVNNAGTITATTGRITQNSNADITNSGSITFTGAGRLQMRGSFSNSGTLSLASAQVIITGNNTASSTVDGYTTTGLTTFSRTAGTVTFNGNVNGAALTINGSGGTLNLGTSLSHTFTGRVTITTGTFQGGSSTLNANLNGTAWAKNGGTFTAGTGTINFGGANQTIGGTQSTIFNNLKLSGSGTKTLPTTALTINGEFQLSGTVTTAPANTVSAAEVVVNTGTTLSLTTRTLNVSGSVNNSGTINLTTGTINQTGTGNFSNSGALTYTGAGVFSLTGDLTNTGTITLASATVNLKGANSASSIMSAFSTTGPVNFTRTAGTVTFNGNVNGAAFTVNGTGGTINLGSSLSHTFTGAVTLTNGTLQGGSSTLNANLTGTAWANNGGTFTAETGTVSFGGASQTIGGTQPTTFNNLTLSGSSTKTLPTSELTINNEFTIGSNLTVSPTNTISVGGNFIIGSSATFNAGNLSHSIAGNLTNNGTLNSSTGTITLNGTSTQVIGGTTKPIGFYNLTIGNAAGVTLAANHQVNVTNNLQINSGALLDIGTERLVDANRIVNNAGAGGLILRASSTVANGSLIFDNIESEPVEGTVEMYTKAYYDAAGPTGFKYKWQYFGIPLRSLATANPTFAGSYVRKHYEPGIGSGYWTTVSNASSLTAVDGYQITQVTPKIVVFSGILENRPISRDLSYTSGAAIPGQHVISNPYTAAIDISEITFGTDLEETVYFFNTGSKSDWENQTETDWSAGQYITVPKNLAGTGGLPGRIPSMQGFVVSTKSPHTSTNISIPYSTAAVKNDTILRAKAVEQKVFTQITVEGSKFKDKMWLFSQPECTHGFDNGWDGRKFFGSTLKPQIYAIEAEGSYQVNAVNNIDSTTLGFRAGQDTEYTMYFDHTNIDQQYQELYLTDLTNNVTVDILQNGSSYTFNTTDTQAGPRFKISAVKVPEPEVEDPGLIDTKFKIYYVDGNIIVNNPSDVAGALYLLDLRQLSVNHYTFGAYSVTSLPVNLPTGIYLVRAVAGKEKRNFSIIIK